MTTILELLSEQYQPDHLVAISGRRCYSYACLQNDIKNIAAQLSQQDEQVWAIYCDDSYRFAVGLLALLYCGKQPVLLPNKQPGFVASIGSKVDAILIDQGESFDPLYTFNMDQMHHQASPSFEFPELDTAAAEISLFTSGSTGTPQRIRKKLSQLEAEIHVLQGLWGAQLNDAIIVSTVNHQHIYGLLFRVLWPLLSGHCFDAKTYQFPEPLLQQVLQQDKTVLVSSPAHLKRIPELVDLSLAQGKVARIFSSGGPLPLEIALQVYNTVGVAVTEVFGSTETGGIAFREQTQMDKVLPWIALPLVETSIRQGDSRLLIKSPFEGSQQWFEMGDRAKFVSEREFMLLGRADKIVKIEEKRLSLLEVEQRLLETAWIKEVAATVVMSNRSNVAVVMVLNEQGDNLLREVGLLVFKQRLTQYLSNYFEAVVLPKKWRVVDRLPYNSQGKLTQADLKRLFELGHQQAPDLTEPEIKVIKHSADQLELELYIPDDLLYFDGHFPDQPILPGVVQIDWAAKFGSRFFSLDSTFKDMEAIKFHEFIRPEDTIKLSLSYDAKKGKLHFSFESSKGRHSSGRLVCG